MQATNFVAILIGILGALLGVYFREMLRHATERRTAAAKLEAYLDYIGKILLNDNSTFLDLVAVSTIWHRLLAQLGAVSMEKVVEAKTQLTTMLEGFAKSSEWVDGLSKQLSEFRKDAQTDGDVFLRQLERYRSAVNGGLMFLTDSEAALLGWPWSSSIIRLRLSLNTTLDSLETIIENLRRDPDYSAEDLAEEAVGVFKEFIEVGYLMKPLQTYARTTRKRNRIVEALFPS